MEYNEMVRSYNRGGRSGGARRTGGDFGRRDSGRREMHKAVCSDCGKDCEVPFRPSGGKPIFCSNCFESKDGGSSRRSNQRGSRGSGFERKDNTNKLLLEQVGSLNVKLDKIIDILSKRSDKS